MAERLNDNPERLRKIEAEADRAVELFSGIEGGGIGGTIVNAKGATSMERLGLRAAKALSRFGMSPEAVHKLTGWFQWPTTKEWLTEFSDRGAKIKDLGGYDEWRPLSDALDHPELFKRFPDLAGTDLRIRADPVSYGAQTPSGWVDPGGGLPHRKVENIHVQGPSVEDIRGTLLHEVQHSVQDRLGLSGGGNSGFVREKARKAIGLLDKKNSLLGDAYQYYDNLDQGMSYLDAMQGLSKETVRKAQQYGRAGVEERLNQIGDAFLGWGNIYDRPYNGYRHLGGEAQAELARYRSNLGPVGLRRAYPLDHLEDLDIDQAKLLELNTPGHRPGLATVGSAWKK